MGTPVCLNVNRKDRHFPSIPTSKLIIDHESSGLPVRCSDFKQISSNWGTCNVDSSGETCKPIDYPRQV